MKNRHVDPIDIGWYLLAMRNSIINRQFRYTFVNAASALAIINIVIYGIVAFLFPRLLYMFSLIPSMILYRHWYWQFVTYMFMHGGIWHLLSNMLALFIFGVPVERKIGSKEFVLFYFLVGTLTGIASYLFYYLTGHNVVLLGASGVIYGVMLLFSVFYPNSVVFIFGVLPIRAPMLVLLYFLFAFFGSLLSFGSIAHSAHLFGLVFAFLYVLIRMRIKPWKAWGL